MDNTRENTNPSSQLLNTGGGKTRSNAIEIPSISLPKGGGAIRGIDEKFSVNAVNGTASFAIPLPFSPARGASPAVSLSYNSGAGNGIFGLGWALGLPSIKRKTDKELPQYKDAVESDTFLFSGAEDLVPEFKKEKMADGSRRFVVDAEGNYEFKEEDSPDGAFRIRFYKPRIEGLFARIERWSSKASGEIRWRVITQENVTTLFGWSAASRISDRKDPDRVFEWLPEFVFDDKGNCSRYIYKPEDAEGFDRSLLHNRNRFENGDITYTNAYLEKVIYGNKTPYKQLSDPYPPETDYLFQTVFDYGEYDMNGPFDKTGSWSFRTDPFSEYRAGFEVRTTRLCRRVLLFHCFSELPGGSALVKSVNFEYDTAAEQGFTFLKSITSFGYIRKQDGSYSSKSLPPVEFAYQQHDWNRDVRTIASEDLVHAPSGLDAPEYQFVDLFNEGLSGILTEQGGGWFYKRNAGNGRFEEARPVSPKPSLAGLGPRLQVMDLDGDGCRQIVSLAGEPKGYFELSDEEEWRAFRAFEKLPNVDLEDANARMIDLNGDGRPEVLITEEDVFTWYASAGRGGFESVHRTVQPFDEEAGPHVVFSDSGQTVFLADMSGDGLTDIVRIRNGEVCYWPNLGYGRFGAKVGMDHAPVFDRPDAFNPSYVRLADIDGSGAADIIYLGKDKCTCWLNAGGNAFRPAPFEIDPFPEMHDQATITVADLLGNGVACIVWSSPLAKDAHAPLRYIDLMNGRKPHIMVSYRNNLGAEVSLEYAPSTAFYLEDRRAGRPWATRLPFPVHCVSRTETRDRISGYRFVSSYTYHHGYFDHGEREFRGFGMVEQTDAEHFDHWIKGEASNIVDKALHQEPVVTKTWFHTGAFLGRERILDRFSREFWYEEMARAGFAAAHHEKALPDALLVAGPAVDTSVVEHLSAHEWREALRACKGMGLRSEVFAHDAPLSDATPAQTKKQLTPYSVATHNCVIELLQPRGRNRHAVFVVKQQEAVTYSYERDPEDPRISHSLNIRLDEYGNVLESASVVYPRTPGSSLTEEQDETLILYTLNGFTNDIDSSGAYRLRLPSETRTYELKGVAKSGDYYSLSDFENVLSDGRSDAALYHEPEKPLTAGKARRRLVEHVRTTYYGDDLQDALPLNHLGSPALPFESYQLAYTPELLDDIFGARASAALMLEGRFTHSEGDVNWWVRSGTTQFIEGSETAAEAQNRFYVPLSYTDPYGAKTTLKYYGTYFLFIEETEDALGNKATVDLFNFRTLAAQRMKDANGNISEAIADELSLIKASAVFGKGNEADDLTGLAEFTDGAEQTAITDFFNSPDPVQLTSLGKNLLRHATTRFVYDFDAYANSGKPAVAASIVREEHFQKNSDSPVQIVFEYSNGLGQVVMKKAQAEPGPARQATLNPDGTYSIADIDTAALTPAQIRWIGSGRTVLNNKGNAVKQYEPYFSVTHQYEDLKELVETGVTPIMYYDAPGRLIRTEMPDGTLSRTEFDSWKQIVYDRNDTVKESRWYADRGSPDPASEPEPQNDPARRAAWLAAGHADTPTVQHFDTLGRPVLSVDHNRHIISNADEFYTTRVKLDIEGNLCSATDARGNVVMQYKYDMLGNTVYQHGMDAGQRWLLINILGNPLRTWDERKHEFQYFYDILHRPAHRRVVGGDGAVPLDHLVERMFYGEAEPDPELKNLRGQVVKHYDTGGLVETPEYDFRGRPKSTSRRLFKHYKTVANWTDTNLFSDLEAEDHTFITEIDALGRITRQTAPDGSVITPSYNESGLLKGETVAHAEPAVTTVYIKNIDYNEKGRRKRIVYGNDVVTRFYYDRETFRLNRLETRRQNSDPLQDWHYTFDPVGNITEIEDKNIPVVFFGNQKVTGVSTYIYDARYRLIEATGRENDAPLAFDGKDNWNDAAFLSQIHPGDPLAMRNYTQSYQYDAVGNITEMNHTAGPVNGWTRTYEYETANNRLKIARAGQGVNSITYSYEHHPEHGFMTSMPHLEDMDWNFNEELVKLARQKRTDGGTPETTYYQYSGRGRRLRKITENQADAGITPTRKEERIYVSGYELYRKHSGPDAGLQRTSLSLLDGGHRFVMIETRNDVDDGTEKHLVRYQLHNHLGSACLELDADAEIVSYEEYHPYGTTAYRAANAAIQSAAKRYRYTGMERDEESGLEYHSARYYLPWLGRWSAADPLRTADGVNLYQYAGCNPVSVVDINGLQGCGYGAEGCGAGTIPPEDIEAQEEARRAEARQRQADAARRTTEYEETLAMLQAQEQQRQQQENEIVRKALTYPANRGRDPQVVEREAREAWRKSFSQTGASRVDPEQEQRWLAYQRRQELLTAGFQATVESPLGGAMAGIVFLTGADAETAAQVACVGQHLEGVIAFAVAVAQRAEKPAAAPARPKPAPPPTKRAPSPPEPADPTTPVAISTTEVVLTAAEQREIAQAEVQLRVAEVRQGIINLRGSDRGVTAGVAAVEAPVSGGYEIRLAPSPLLNVQQLGEQALPGEVVLPGSARDPANPFLSDAERVLMRSSDYRQILGVGATRNVCWVCADALDEANISIWTPISTTPPRAR